MTMIVNTRGVTLPIDRTGSGQPVVFFNGGGATTVIWNRTIAALGDDYEAITFDFRGHGRASRASSYKLADFIADAEAVMTALKIGGPIVVGWSLWRGHRRRIRAGASRRSRGASADRRRTTDRGPADR